MSPGAEHDARAAALTGAALLGFAANSVLCRLALAERTIDAAIFTGIRLAAGAAMLALVSTLAPRRDARADTGASWGSALALFAYAAAFSFAYLRLPTGVGALILFGLVQLTMIGWGLAHGERLSARKWLGIGIAACGLLVLTAPGLSAPDPLGAALMALAGVAWGAYSIRGKGAADPLRATAGNFARTLPFALVLLLVAHAFGATGAVEARGVWLALASGALASGLAYSIWYAALRYLAATQAAVVQLSVPVLAAAAGVVLLDEAVTLRLVLAGVAILTGVALAVLARRATGPR